MKKLTWLILAFLFVDAKSEEMGEIVVTGSRITSYYDMPAITVTKNADFLVQEIRVTNDSRSPQLRKTEIIQTINNLINSAKKQKGIELSYGEGFLTPVKLNDESLELLSDKERVDTSYVDIYVKVEYDQDKPSKEQIGQLRRFISDANLVSRTEILLDGDIGLSLKEPEQYRYEILGKIAQENQKTVQAIGNHCMTVFHGLEGRVEWERSDLGEVTLYIAYETEISCQNG